MLFKPEYLRMVAPQLVKLVQAFEAQCKHSIVVVRGATDDATQRALWYQGRDPRETGLAAWIDGPHVSEKHPHGLTVTKAKDTKETAHGPRWMDVGGYPVPRAAAVDCAACDSSGNVNWTKEYEPTLIAQLSAMNVLANTLFPGVFRWGGEWEDFDHWELKNWREYLHVEGAAHPDFSDVRGGASSANVTATLPDPDR